MTAAAVVAMAVYVAANAWVGCRLWFWWDELTIISERDEPLQGLLTAHWGNVFPLGRLAFMAQNAMFGNSYGFYVAVNAAFVAAICAVHFRLVSRSAGVGSAWYARTVVPVALVVTLALSRGTVYDVQWGFQVAWFLSILAMLSATWWIIRYGLSAWWMLAAIAVSCAALASPTIPLTLFSIALLLLRGRLGITFASQLRASIGLVVWAVVLSAGTYWLGTSFPSPDADANLPPVVIGRLTQDVGHSLLLVIAGVIGWLLKPISILLTFTHLEGSTTLGGLEGQGLIVVPAGILLIAILLVLTGWGARSGPRRMAILILLVGLAAFQASVATRGLTIDRLGGGDGMHARYDPLGLVLATAVWGIAVQGVTRGRLSGILRVGASGLVVTTAVVGLILSPIILTSASQATRRGEAAVIQAVINRCESGLIEPDLASVQNTFKGRLCEIWHRIGG